MKAVVYRTYGGPDVLSLEELTKPQPQDDQVLVKIHASSANPIDWHYMRGTPFFMRLTSGLMKPKNIRIGSDIAGRVEAVGPDVTELKPGDEVYGDFEGFGGFAEYACGPEKALALKPDNASFAEAAAIPIAGLTALQSLRDRGQLKPGQHVLVNGASGGVGTYAVQIAKAYGATVSGVCSTRNVELVRSLGADHVVDYTSVDFTHSGPTYDLILDAVGNLSLADLNRALKPDGIAVVVGLLSVWRILQIMLFGSRVGKKDGKSIGFMLATIKQDDLKALHDLFTAEKIKSVIDKRYPLNETAEAIRYLETSRARGKIIIDIGDTDAA
jgi:NADPH:quinone reductase-like Zn-dependent oxidoreductase